MILRRFMQHTKEQNWFAVGLDVLVVIVGIFLGMQVTDWNEERKGLNKEQEILIQLKSDYENNLIQLDQKISHREHMLKSFQTLFTYIDNPSAVDKDDLIPHLSVIIGTPTFDPIENNLIDSGDIELINNNELKRLLISWPANSAELQYVEKVWFRKLFQDVVPELSDIGILRSVLNAWWNDEKNLEWILDDAIDKKLHIGTSVNAPRSNEILKNNKIEGILSVATSMNKAANVMSQVLRIRILKIIDLLNREIESD